MELTAKTRQIPNNRDKTSVYVFDLVTFQNDRLLKEGL
jgi:hypothetical protein